MKAVWDDKVLEVERFVVSEVVSDWELASMVAGRIAGQKHQIIGVLAHKLAEHILSRPGALEIYESKEPMMATRRVTASILVCKRGGN